VTPRDGPSNKSSAPVIPERTVTVLLFVLACWFCLWREWGFLISLAFGSTIWFLIVLVPRWIGHSPR
jgi:hypothetical protein